MSAPSTVYSNNTLQDYTTTSNEVLTLLPLNLAEYNGNMRELFYLTEVKGLKDKSDRDVLIGLVAEGSDNYYMRPSNRIGKGRIYKDGVTYAICNDGGLNTFAKAEVVEVIYRFANYIKVRFNHKAAYYSATHRAGVQITSENDAYGWEHVILTDKPAKSTQSVVDVITPNVYNEGDIITLYPYTHNDENPVGSGQKQFLPVSFALKPKIHFINLYKIADATSDVTQGIPYTVIISQDDYTKQYGLNELFARESGENSKMATTVFPTGTQGADTIVDDTFTSLLPEGFYYGMPSSWQGTNKEIVYIEASGNVSKWYDYTPAATSYKVTTSIRYNATEVNVFGGRIEINALVGSAVRVDVVLQLYNEFEGWKEVEGTKRYVSFISAGYQDISASLDVLQLWEKARWHVISTSSPTTEIVENEYKNPKA